MRSFALLLLVFLLLAGNAAAEALEKADLSALEEFAGEYAPELDFRQIAEDVTAGEADFERLLDWMRSRMLEPLESVLQQGAGMLAPVLLLAVLGCVGIGRGGARFLVLLHLLLCMLQAVSAALNAAQNCLTIAVRFSDAAAPAMSALMTAAGMSGSAALLTPATAIAGSIAGELFLSWGMPLCRFALCTSAAGSLSPALDLSRATRLLKKCVSWGTGLCFTVFTAMLALQGNAASSLDGMALRTAKYAVDSASGIIGSGVSDVWESYVGGMQLARSAVGFSGVAVLLAALFRPLLLMGASLLLLHLVSVVLDVLGEKNAARAAEQMGDVCRMGLELSTGALAIATILLGAGMAAGRGLLG